MLPFFKNTAYRPLGRIGAIVVIAAALTFAGWCDGALAKTADRAAAKQRTFASPDEAVKALIAAAEGRGSEGVDGHSRTGRQRPCLFG